MPARRLVVCDSHDLSWIPRVEAGLRSGDMLDVLVLGASRESFLQRHGSRLDDLPGCSVLNPADHSERAHRLVNDFVLGTIPRIPEIDLNGETLGKLLDTSDGNLWWWLQTSEKNPLRDPLVGRLYRLAMARLVVDAGSYDEIWLDLAERPVRALLESSKQNMAKTFALPKADRRSGRWWDRFPLIRYWVHAFAALADFLAVRVLLRLTGWPLAQPGKGGLFVFTIYPYWWLRPFSSNPTERFFPALSEMDSAQFLAWLVWPKQLWRHRAAIGEVVKSRRVVVLQPFARMRDALGLLSPSRFRRLSRFPRRLRAYLRVDFLGYDVGPMIGDDLVRSLTGAEPCLDHLLFHATRNFAERVRPRALVNRVEFQTSENPLLFAMRGRGRTVGFLHSPVVDNFLPMRFAPGELSAEAAATGPRYTRPIPDAMLVCGGGGAKLLEAGGYPPEHIATCGPQRHGPLIARREHAEPASDLRQRLGLSLDRPVVVVALALLESETEALFASLIHASPDLPDFQLLVKTHPNNLKTDTGLAAAVETIGPERLALIPGDRDVYDYVAAADALICIGSWIAFDAIALGVMPVVFEDSATYAGTSLGSYGDSLFVVRNAADLTTALFETLSNSQAAREKRRNWTQVIESVFGDLETPLAVQLTRALARVGVPAEESPARGLV